MKHNYKLIFSWTIIMMMHLSTCFSQTNSNSTNYHWNIWLNHREDTPDSIRLNSARFLMTKYFTLNKDSLLVISNQLKKEGNKKNNNLWVSDAYSSLGRYYYTNKHLDSAAISYHQSLNYAPPDDHKRKIKMYTNLGGLYLQDSRTDSSLFYLKKAIGDAKKYNLSDLSLDAYANLIYHHISQGEYLEALEAFIQANTVEGIEEKVNPLFYANIAAVFERLGLKKEAKENFKKSYELYQKSNHPIHRLRSYAVLLQLSTDLEEIKAVVKESLALADSIDVKDVKVFLLSAIGNTFTNLEEYGLAETYFKHNLALADSIGFQKLKKASSMNSLALIYYHKKEFRKSLALCRQVMPFYRENRDYKVLETLYTTYSNNFEALGIIDSAFYYIREKEKIQKIRDDNKLIKAAVSKYYDAKTQQEKQILALEKENAEQQAQQATAEAKQNFLIAVMIGSLFIGVSLFFYFFYKQKKTRSILLEKMNKKLENEKKRLTRMNKKLKRFSGIVSHDILSNLDLILSCGNLYANSMSNNEQLTQYYEITQTTSRQLKNYCKELLKEARRAHVQRKLLHNPMPIIHEVLGRFSTTLRKVNFQVDLEELSPTELPPAVIEQLFQNLISNAIKYANIATIPRLKIAEKKNSKGQTLWIIEDNGPGIPIDQRDKIFIGCLNKDNDSVGQQLGLSFVRASLRESGGEIWAKENAEGGASFVVLLP